MSVISAGLVRYSPNAASVRPVPDSVCRYGVPAGERRPVLDSGREGNLRELLVPRFHRRSLGGRGETPDLGKDRELLLPRSPQLGGQP